MTVPQQYGQQQQPFQPTGFMRAGSQGPNVRPPIVDRILVRQEQPWHPSPFFVAGPMPTYSTVAPVGNVLVVRQQQPPQTPSMLTSGVYVVGATTHGRVSQAVTEALVRAAASARGSQSLFETLAAASPKGRATQSLFEVSALGSPKARVSQSLFETLAFGAPKGRVSQIVVEVLVLNLQVPVPPIYPDLIGLGYNVTWTPIFYNMPTEVAASGAELDVAVADEPLHDFELTYDFLRDLFRTGSTEFKTMAGFFMALRGTVGRFLFEWQDDHHRDRQLVGVTDGATNQYVLKRTFGTDGNTSDEPIGYLNTTRPFKVYLDSVLQEAASYTVDQTTPGNQVLNFLTTPETGHNVYVDMDYYYYCKFKENNNTFEKFLNQYWLTKSVKIHSCRPFT